MAIEFARVRYVKRSDGGNASRTAAYNGRADVRCERTGERFYFAHRDPTLHHEVLLPEGASERLRDAAVLWNTAQAAEKRKDAQEARELLLALPSDPGLDLEDWGRLTEEFAREHFVSKGVAVQIDIHPPHEGDRNVHAHLLITTRRLEGESFSVAKARDLDPEVRTGRNGRPVVAEGEAWGALWRDCQNRYFEREGLDLRVDETGIVAQVHEGPVRLRTVPAAASARAEAVDEENAAAARDPERVLATLTRRYATFTELDIERQLKKHVGDAEERAALRRAVLAHDSVVALHERADGEFTGRYTTTAVRDEEEQVLAAAAKVGRRREGVGERNRAAATRRRVLDDEQEAAFLRATGTDGLVLVEGIAGSGKSYSVAAIREAHEAAGWRVVGLAPTNTVADDLRRGGFRHGSTVHLELYYQDNARHDRAPAWDRRTCVVVDEAAMLDTATYARLMRQAADTGAKMVLVGDDRQLSSIERGGMFTALKERHGSAVIGRVRRQDEDWQRHASEDFAGGRVAEGLRAYAERGHMHWSADLEESRVRLLSDWDQDSRERPSVNRFVYASTNAEVDQLNQAIRDIRVRRGEIGDEITVETSRGRIGIGAGDRIQFFGNDRRAGLYNGTLGTVTAVDGKQLTVTTDSGREVGFDAGKFDQFGLGYAGTVYRGQGKTQTEVYALYDNAFAWNGRTAYVGLTRHRAEVNLYVPRSLAADELALGRQMGRRIRDEASLTYATAAEVVPLHAARGDRTAAADRQGARLPQADVATLRALDLTAYARDVHGYDVEADPAQPAHYTLRRGKGVGAEILQVRRAPDGHWTYGDPANPRDRGDILDFAKREGAPDLASARKAVGAYAANLKAGRPPERSDARETRSDRKPEAADAYRARMTAFLEAARERLSGLGHRLEAAFGRIMEMRNARRPDAGAAAGTRAPRLGPSEPIRPAADAAPSYGRGPREKEALASRTAPPGAATAPKPDPETAKRERESAEQEARVAQATRLLRLMAGDIKREQDWENTPD